MDSLIRSNIFPIPVGNCFKIPDEKLYLVYAPFSDNALIATTDNVEEMAKYMEDKSRVTDPDIIETMETMLDHDPIKFSPRLTCPELFNRLAILPNNVCNFNCSYCYSAPGRSGKVLDQNTLKATLDYFIDPKRFATGLAGKHGFETDISLVTNGSVISDEIMKVLKDNQTGVSVSFEILEEIQNKQRGHFDLVCQTIDKLISNGLAPKFRSTITPASVDRQKEMVEYVVNRFPGVTDIMFEAVTDAESFGSSNDIKAFYDSYTEHFFEAQHFGAQKGLKVECSASRNLNLLVERFCPGTFALTPEGDISMCTRITSPLDTGFDDCVYGKFNESGKIHFDLQKLKKLSDINIYSMGKCRDCFAKWHCGGGCMAQRYAYNEEVLNLICDYTRSFTKRMLLERLENQYREFYQVSLEEAVLNIKNI
jgi:uncharacterized protein